jgi:hypothetical protein
MTRRPDCDERIILPVRSVEHNDRVYLPELCKYLHHNPAYIRKFAKRQGILYRAGRGAGRQPIEYVSEWGAMRIIAHVRAIQGEIYQQGRDFHAVQEALAAKRAKRLAENREKTAAVANELNLHSALARCIPPSRNRR